MRLPMGKEKRYCLRALGICACAALRRLLRILDRYRRRVGGTFADSESGHEEFSSPAVMSADALCERHVDSGGTPWR